MCAPITLQPATAATNSIQIPKNLKSVAGVGFPEKVAFKTMFDPTGEFRDVKLNAGSKFAALFRLNCTYQSAA